MDLGCTIIKALFLFCRLILIYIYMEDYISHTNILFVYLRLQKKRTNKYLNQELYFFLVNSIPYRNLVLKKDFNDSKYSNISFYISNKVLFSKLLQNVSSKVNIHLPLIRTMLNKSILCLQLLFTIIKILRLFWLSNNSSIQDTRVKSCPQKW